jgi:Lactoylglutathione lyase and related lyases
MVLPLLTRLDHVGIACRDLRRAIDMYRETFGLGVLSLEENEEQGVREAMLAVGPSGSGPGSLGVSYIQLLEPLSPDTPVGRFIARRGEGIHHVGTGSRISEKPWPRWPGPASGWSTSGPGTGPWEPRSPSCTRRSGGRADRTRTAAQLSVMPHLVDKVI